MADKSAIRVLEGVGYVGAIMLGAGELLNEEKLSLMFRVIGMVLCIIVAVRLLAAAACAQCGPEASGASEAAPAPAETARDEETT